MVIAVYRSFGTAYRPHLQGQTVGGASDLEDGRPTDCHETSGTQRPAYVTLQLVRARKLVHTVARACNLASHTEPKWRQVPHSLKTRAPCAYGTGTKIGIDDGFWRIRNKSQQNCACYVRWVYLSACNNFITAKWVLTKFCTNVMHSKGNPKPYFQTHTNGSLITIQ